MPKGVYNTFIHVKIGSVEFHQTEDLLCSLQNTRQGAGFSNNCIITLYDDTALLVENELINAKEREIVFSYGYVGGPVSPEFTSIITGFSVEFTSRGTQITLECSPKGTIESTNPKQQSYSGKTINDIVAEICSRNGWNLVVNVLCKPKYDDPTNPMGGLKVYIQDTMGDEDFIKKKLIPDAVSFDGMGDYRFYVESTTKDKRATFMPSGWKGSKVQSKYSFIVGQDNEKIISFNPEYNTEFTALMGSTESVAVNTDPVSNEVNTYKVIQEGIKNKDNIKAHLAGSSYSFSQLESIAMNMYYRARNLSYPATLELVGDPTLKPLQTIEVVVLTPHSQLHHSSGKYFIINIVDNVELGSFTSTLSLQKNMDSIDINKQTAVNGVSMGPRTQQSTITKDGKVIPQGVPNTDVNAIITSYVGTPYVWGGEDRSGADCSGFVNMVYRDNGWGSYLEKRDTVDGYWNYMASSPDFVEISDPSQLESGDVIIWNNGEHMGFSLGEGKVCHASTSRQSIVVDNMFGGFVTAYRYKKLGGK